MGIINAKDFESELQVIARGDYSDAEKEWLRAQCIYDPDPTGWMELHDWCYVCGEKLVIPCIFWHGNPRSKNLENSDRCQIWLHPACAAKLAEKLLGDVQKLEKDKARKGDRRTNEGWKGPGLK